MTDIESFVTGRPTALSIDALEPTEVLVLDKASRPSLESEFPARDRILRMLAETALVGFQKRLMGGMRKTAAERYLNFRRLYPGLELRIPQYHIAAYLGISPEFLSKLRKRLIRETTLATGLTCRARVFLNLLQFRRTRFLTCVNDVARSSAVRCRPPYKNRPSWAAFPHDSRCSSCATCTAERC